jgi:hypothetical protein
MAIGIVGAVLCAQDDAKDRLARQRLEKNAQFVIWHDLPNRRIENMKPYAGVIDLSQDMINDYAAPFPPLNLEQELYKNAKRSDAIVIGTALGKLSALTPGHSYVYSDWTIKVSRVFKNVSKIGAAPGDEITVVEPGGDLTIDGVHVQAHNKSEPELTLGHEYILYLKAHPESSSFQGYPRIDVTAGKLDLLLDPRDPTPLREFCQSISMDAFLAAVQNNLAEQRL